MPYKIEGLNVVESDTGKIVGTHKTPEEAQAHMRALYANIPDAKKKDDEEIDPIEKAKEPSKEYLTKLWEEVKKHLPAWLFDQVHKIARGYAGGKSFPRMVDETENDIEVPKMKYDDEKQIVYSVVYAPGEVDTQGDWASAETIEKAAHNFLAKYRKITVDHKKEADGYEVVESYTAKHEETWTSNDGEIQTVPKGSWILGTRIKNKELWKALKSGDKTGYSLTGVGRHGEEDAPVLRYEMSIKYAEDK